MKESFANMCNICNLLLPLVSLPFIRPSIISSSKLSCMPQNMPSPMMLSLLKDFHYLSNLLYFCQHFFIWNFVLPTNSFILCHIHISKASNRRTSAFISVHVSAAYSATLQIKHLIILFFNILIIRPKNSSDVSGNIGLGKITKVGRSGFYRATACNATHGIAVAILSVCPSVCPSDACIVTKLNNALRIFWYHTKRQSL